MVHLKSLSALALFSTCKAWIPVQTGSLIHSARIQNIALPMSLGNVHGQGSCFMPLKQLEQDYYSPRIIQVRWFDDFCFRISSHRFDLPDSAIVLYVLRC